MKYEEYKNLMKKINISDEAQNRILERSLNYKKESCFGMKRKNIVVLVAAAILVLGVTVYAAGNIIASWRCCSSSKPDYTSLPQKEQCIKDVGFAPVLIENFENGYKFENGVIIKNSLDDESGKSVKKFKSINFYYVKDNKELVFSQNINAQDLSVQGTVIANINGTEIYYTEYKNKVVPADYQLTKEDEKAQANGKLVMSYGSDKIEINTVNGVCWEENNMHYSLTKTEGNISSDDLVGMAKEIIEYK